LLRLLRLLTKLQPIRPHDGPPLQPAGLGKLLEAALQAQLAPLGEAGELAVGCALRVAFGVELVFESEEGVEGVCG
jgi:hypothetical protein